ncbi:enoyl-CoA hydratase/isomerase family protein [Bradyrhizobium elkanii]|uniref:enoyl-CoA hydratase/isomerase family protein n=1 Tax=Bradyrhizobium elkanii TaxID=29448 RepID=UPI001BADB8DB|nr:enoyl-CoA hydratase/isomerase family protein [Bradyrhizobium elkanii]MBR1165069.1 enoyl-CoA hydratase/isomerase family protein [Bradyrhizobium elkanii]
MHDILYEVNDRVAVITLNRPKKLNALSRRLRGEFQQAIAAADHDPDVRVVLLKGAGGRAFSTGWDLSDDESKDETSRTMNSRSSSTDASVRFLRAPWDCSKPVIAMIDGHCLAGGMELAQMCDIRYCSEGSRFGLPEVRLGLGMLTVPALSWLAGQRCRELIYSGDTFDAAEANRLGLVQRVYPKERLESEVLRIAKRMSRVALPALTWSKKALNNTLQAAGFDAAMQYGAGSSLIIGSMGTEFSKFGELVHAEGMKAAIAWRDSLFAPFESES